MPFLIYKRLENYTTRLRMIFFELQELSDTGKIKFLVTLNYLKLTFTTNFGTNKRDTKIHSAKN